MSLLLRPVPKSHGAEPGSRHIVPAAAPPQATSHQLNPAPGTWTMIFYLFVVAGISSRQFYQYFILNENEIHNRQPVIHKTFGIFKSFREAFKCYIGMGGEHRQNVTFFKVVLDPFHKYGWMWDVGISSYTVKNKVRDREEGGNWRKLTTVSSCVWWAEAGIVVGIEDLGR